MLISFPSPRRIALLGLLLVGLAILADGVARMELASAVNDALIGGTPPLTTLAASDD